jgi:integrase
MASIGWEGKRARILWRNAAKKWQTLRLGPCDKRMAETARVAVGHLLIAKRHGGVPHHDAVRWLEGIDDELHGRAAARGLCQPRAAAVVVTLGEMLTAFFEHADVKPASRVRMMQARAGLETHFTKARDVATIADADADSWRAGLTKAGYSPATISRTVLYARQFWKWAIKRSMAKANPFVELKAGPQTNAARQTFVTREMIAQVIDQAPDAEWRLLIALSRFGGLRIPSEGLSLRWSDVDWLGNRLTVRSCKTEHHQGKGERIIPLFPEIREHLQAVYDAAPVGSVNVIQTYRAGQNLNPHLRRIIKRAGLIPWEKTWHNLRSSRQTELAADFPLATVCAWIGNSRAIAAGHYLQVTDADWARAVAEPEAATKAATQARTIAPKAHKPKTQKPQNSSELVGFGVACAHMETGLVGRAGLEPATPAFSMRCSTN